MHYLGFNIFKTLSGERAFTLGIIIIAITGIFAALWNVHFDGILDSHIGLDSPLIWHLLEPLINIGLLAIGYRAALWYFKKKNIRWIDILGFLMYARWPLLINTLFVFLVKDLDVNPENIEQVKQLLSTHWHVFLIYTLISIACLIWYVGLLFNAFALLNNDRSSKTIVAFIALLIALELISKIVFITIL
jgi:hypothetical protein